LLSVSNFGSAPEGVQPGPAERDPGQANRNPPAEKQRDAPVTRIAAISASVFE
jgi:hypothetical protein